MTSEDKMIAILNSKTAEQIKDIIVTNGSKYTEEAEIVENYALRVLSRKIPPQEFVDFCNSL